LLELHTNKGQVSLGNAHSSNFPVHLVAELATVMPQVVLVKVKLCQLCLTHQRHTWLRKCVWSCWPPGLLLALWSCDDASNCPCCRHRACLATLKPKMVVVSMEVAAGQSLHIPVHASTGRQHRLFQRRRRSLVQNLDGASRDASGSSPSGR
jgi:hypothetical protein